MLIFLCISWSSSILFTRLITEQVYWDDALGVIYLVDCRALTVFMTNFSLTPNVLTVDMTVIYSISMKIEVELTA